jgi:hypothetical protein
MVEFIVILPILLIMLSGLIEFGFLLNFYLDLIDAARDIARYGANIDPLIGEDPIPANRTCTDTQYFYRMITCMMPLALGDQIDLDSTSDDVVVSSFGITDNRVRFRLPDSDGWSWSAAPTAEGGLGLATPNRVSGFTSAEVEAMLDASAPARGAVLVEIYYNYNMVMALPWITAFVPNPVTLHAYTIMPNTFIEPTRTPSP